MTKASSHHILVVVILRHSLVIVAIMLPPPHGWGRSVGGRPLPDPSPPRPDHGSRAAPCVRRPRPRPDWRSEEHTSELQSLMRISYAVFCLKQKKNKTTH